MRPMAAAATIIPTITDITTITTIPTIMPIPTRRQTTGA